MTRQLYTAETQPTPEAKTAGQAALKTARDILSAHKVKVAQRWIQVFDSIDTPPQLLQTLGEKIMQYGGEVLETKHIVEAENIHRVISDKPMTEDEWLSNYAKSKSVPDAS